MSKQLTLRTRGSVRLQASADPATVPGRAVEIVAYTGEPLSVTGYDLPVIVDLASVQVDQQQIPLLYDHCPNVDFVLGRTHAIRNDGTTLTASGRVWGHNERSRSVLEAAQAGHEWETSIGAIPASVEPLASGQVVYLNNREYTGPALVAHGTLIREISFVVLGADRHTSAILARLKGSTMKPTFEEWLASLGFTPDALDPTQLANMTLLYNEEYGSEEDATATPPATDPAATPPATDASAATPPVTPPANAGARPLDITARLREDAARETQRIADVQRICASAPAIATQAIREGWTAERAELQMLRASRPAPTGPAAHTGRGTRGIDQFQVIHAALSQTARLPNLEASFSAPVLETAHRQFRSRMGLQDMIHASALANGYSGASRFSFDPAGMLRAAFSTTSLPGILSNTANKFLLTGFMGVDQVYAAIAAKRSVNDFKEITSYRMSGGFVFHEVGPDGQLKHGALGEESYTNQADTYGIMFAITRKDLINDDLGAITDTPARIGRGAALKLNKVFWTEFLDNSTFFSTGNLNYFEGASSNLQASSLVTAEQKFRDQTDPDGEPLGVEPAILLVPTALNRTARELMASASFVAGGGASGSQIPSTNTWQGNFTPLTTPYLSNSSYPGYSSTGWYLLANPADMPVIEIAYLNGVESPTVESTDADFNTLGIQMRGYFDFGVNKQDYRGGVKSKGAA